MSKKCFIIMPITVAEHLIDVYEDGSEHFRHILNGLMIPAVEKAGYEAIPPEVSGSDHIQASIIKNLEASDMVLCDMSGLNPNVFFEYGIRTSLNKPVCVVKDDKTKKVPFDIASINYQEYVANIQVWNIKEIINSMANHIKESETKCKGTNPLWNYYGMKSVANDPSVLDLGKAKDDYVISKLESIEKAINVMGINNQFPRTGALNTMFPSLAGSQSVFGTGLTERLAMSKMAELIINDIAGVLDVKTKVLDYMWTDNTEITITFSNPVEAGLRKAIRDMIRDKYGILVAFTIKSMGLNLKVDEKKNVLV